MENTLFHIDSTLTDQAYNIMPYSQHIGLQIGRDEQGSLLFYLPFNKKNIGNIFLPALHGGLIGGFLESCATLFLYHNANMQELPKMVDFSLDYLRTGKAEDCFSRCILTRQGSRITNVASEIWQSNPSKPIAIARTHFQMP